MFRIAIAGNYPPGVADTFRSELTRPGVEVIFAPDQASFDALSDADVVLLRILKMPEKDIARLPSLKAILRWGVGFDTVDIAAAGKRGVSVCNTPGANAYAVAELTVLMMLALGRRLVWYQNSIREGQWDKRASREGAMTLNDKLVGVVGGGNIGRQVARKVQAFGARVQYYDAVRLPAEQEAAFGMTFVPLETLLGTSDIVTLHVPLMDSTRHMIGREEIARMKHGAMLINAARGGLMDDEAVAEAVLQGRLAGAGIDTPEEEPPRADSPLRGNPNILLTPHVGGDVADVANVAVPMICANMKKLIAGKEPDYVVNRAFLREKSEGECRV